MPGFVIWIKSFQVPDFVGGADRDAESEEAWYLNGLSTLADPPCF